MNSISVSGGTTGVRVIVDGDNAGASEVAPNEGKGFEFKGKIEILVNSADATDAGQETPGGGPAA